MMKKKLKVFTIINLGCFKNLVDSQAIMGNMIQHGFYYTDDLDRADIIIVNTCGFINPAKKESIQTIKEAVQRKLYGSRFSCSPKLLWKNQISADMHLRTADSDLRKGRCMPHCGV